LKKENKTRLKKFIPIYIMMLPGMAYLFVNNYLPMFGIIIAFKKINWQKGILKSEWVGFSNFKYLFMTKDAFVMTRNTILYNITFIVLGTFFSIAMAIFLNEIRSKIIKKLYQTLILLPYLMSMVLVSFFVYAVLSSDTGFLNNTVFKFLELEPVNWYQDKTWWPLILIIVQLWSVIGFNSVIYLSSIVGISLEYYEAARLDGANKWQQIKNITIPMIKSTIVIMFILGIGRIFSSDFGLFYQVPRNSGALYPVTQTIDTYVYVGLMKLGNIEMSAAASVYQSIVGFVLVVVSNIIIRKVSKENALF